jgi:hypothetical protein
MTLNDYIRIERRRIEQYLNDGAPLFLAAQSALSDMADRIFVKGRDVGGGTFVYDYRRPIYVNPVDSPGRKFKPQGKPKTAVAPNGQVTIKRQFKKFAKDRFSGFGSKIQAARKTKWFPSYGDYRKAIGFEYRFVNWELTGKLKFDIENRVSGQLTPRRVNNKEYVIKVLPNNAGKLRGLRAKYPGVFVISKNERKEFNRIYGKELLRLIQEGRR